MVEDEVRWRESKYIFMNRFLFAAWNIRFCFCAARLVEFRLVSVGDEIELRGVEMAACVVGREGLNFGCHREFRVWYLGESRRYLH